jgi:ferredoxin, 2Fe-2S
LGGTNPYIEKTDVELPQKAYKITFNRPQGPPVVFEVDPAKLPYGPTGLPGSILDIALNGGAEGIDLEHACGGVCACSTCHVKIKHGLASCNEPTDDELDQLDEAPDISLESRLGCQCVPNGTMDLVVEIPAWNKNLVKEGH